MLCVEGGPAEGLEQPNNQPTKEGPAADAGELLDLERLRLSQDFFYPPALRPPLTHVPVRNPAGEWFVQTHPGPDYRRRVFVARPEGDPNPYRLTPEVWDELRCGPCVHEEELVASITPQNNVCH